MTDPPPAPDADDSSVIGGGDEELLAALMDDFLRRHRQGERPTVDEYAARHPHLAASVHDLFPAALVMEQEVATPAERVGATIGRYRLLERIGEGGFGMVYMAEQLTPVRRKVALKVIKPGVDTRQVIARFEAERQALALMDHENIARVLDAGATDSGRPYFVMELVHGVPITQFCDEGRLPPRARLELFVQVCRAVQHAHTKGIIHRDLKPTNVLVTLHEGVAVPKVIDFGVAKATGQPLTEATLFTNFAQMVGTPLYMSPEQAEMTSIDVDTRSDVYSLGVLLYELLTGTTPVDKDRLKQAAFDQVRRIIREEDPPRPSTRLSTMGEEARRTVCAHRKSDPKHLGRLVRGELDWIVMKALEKERSRRYESASGLGRDVERYLADEPVLAGPPTVRYRFGKFARRHWRALAVASLFMLLLVGAVVALSVALVAVNRERQAKQVALEAEGRRRQQARAALDAMSSAVIEEWLTKQAALLPEHKQFLEQALHSYEEFAADTGQEEESRAGVARAYLRAGRIRETLGQTREARESAGRARALFAALATDFPDAQGHREGLAATLQSLGRLASRDGSAAAAEAAYRESLNEYRKLIADYPEVIAHRRGMAMTLMNLGLVLRKLDRVLEAEEVTRQSIGVLKQLTRDLPGDSAIRVNLARAMASLGLQLHTSPGRVRDASLDHAGRDSEAAALLAEGVEIFRELVAEYPMSADFRDAHAIGSDHLAGVLRDLGRNAEAEDVFAESLVSRRRLAADFPAVPEYWRGLAMTLNNLGILYKNTDRPREAEDLFRQSLEIHKKLAADRPGVPDHQSEVAGAMVNLARLLMEQKDLPAARQLLEDALPYHQAALKALPLHPSFRRFYRNNRWRLAEVLLELEDHAAAAEITGQFLDAAVERPRDAHTAAALLARCAALAGSDERLTEPERQRRAADYGERAVAALRRAVTEGFDDFDQLRLDDEFDALRSREDFGALLSSGPATTGPSTQP